jgi:hypothetical protein
MARLGERHGTAWTPEEDQQLKEAHTAGMSVTELSARHQRGRGAIRSRLLLHGLLQPYKTASSDARISAASSVPLQQAESCTPTATEGVTPASSAISPNRVDFSLPSTSELQDATKLDASDISARINSLISSLTDLKEYAEIGKLPRGQLAAVAVAYEGLERSLQFASDKTIVATDSDFKDDPLPDQLRSGLRHLVRTCVSRQRDCYVALRTMGLVGDGKPWTLAIIGDALGLSRERIRQLKVRAFKRIDAHLARRIATASRLRQVLTRLSPSTDWKSPEATAIMIVKYATSHIAAVRQLTIICCKAAGNHAAELNRLADAAAVKACSDPELLGEWRLDRWPDAAAKVVGPLQQFHHVPDDLMGSKRIPGIPRDTSFQVLNSRKLNRPVVCESGLEFQVYSWIEHSPDVSWYQEQPTSVLYRLRGYKRLYFPDVAVLDNDGRLIIVEVKPRFTMYREETLVKALAALSTFGARGIGYLLLDSSGRTLADLALVPFHVTAAEKVEKLLATGQMSYGAVMRELDRLGASTDIATFASMVVNRDWAVTTKSPVLVSKLPRDVSFHPFIDV